jgi:hypothetical protein
MSPFPFVRSHIFPLAPSVPLGSSAILSKVMATDSRGTPFEIVCFLAKSTLPTGSSSKVLGRRTVHGNVVRLERFKSASSVFMEKEKYEEGPVSGSSGTNLCE